MYKTSQNIDPHNISAPSIKRRTRTCELPAQPDAAFPNALWQATHSLGSSDSSHTYGYGEVPPPFMYDARIPNLKANTRPNAPASILQTPANNGESPTFHNYGALCITSTTSGTAVPVSIPSTYPPKPASRFPKKYNYQSRRIHYYGYRYYSPGQGRFLNRDPIEEAGGVNLYAFVGNDPINAWDYMGLSEVELSLDVAAEVRVERINRRPGPIRDEFIVGNEWLLIKHIVVVECENGAARFRKFYSEPDSIDSAGLSGSMAFGNTAQNFYSDRELFSMVYGSAEIYNDRRLFNIRPTSRSKVLEGTGYKAGFIGYSITASERIDPEINWASHALVAGTAAIGRFHPNLGIAGAIASAAFNAMSGQPGPTTYSYGYGSVGWNIVASCCGNRVKIEENDVETQSSSEITIGTNKSVRR